MKLSEADLIERELTIRDLRLSKEVLETRRSAVRWLALSLGILNPGESRLGSLAVLDSLVYYQFLRKKDPTARELAEYINKNWEQINEKTLRYHLLRMKKMGFVENEQGRFYFKPPAIGERFDAYSWSAGVFETFYKGIAGKVGDVVKDMKSKDAVMYGTFMKGEIYYWIAGIVIILAIALYVRYYYSQKLDIGISFSGSVNKAAYEYQMENLSLYVVNNGSDVKDFDLGIMVNGNLSKIYNVTLGSGKETEIQFSYTFDSPGKYNFTAIGDPAGLYTLADRNSARSSVQINVTGPEKPYPAQLLPGNGSSLYSSNMSSLGYAVASYLSSNYSIGQVELSDIGPVNRFLGGILNLTGGYIANISYAGADYSDAKAYSLWLSGYVRPSVVAAAARALNLSIENKTVGLSSVSMVSLNSNSTLCAWYGGGWIKTLSYEGNLTCLAVLQGGPVGAFLNNTVESMVPVVNGSAGLASFSYGTGLTQRFGRLSFVTGALFYSVIWKNITQNQVCYGIVNNVKGTSYCSVYMLENNGVPSNTALIKTTEYVGEYNATVFSLVNETDAAAQAGVNIALLRDFNLSGKALNFSSGIINSCSFPAGFSCSNVTYGNGEISFRVRNEMNSSVSVSSAGCYSGTEGPLSTLNSTLEPGKTLVLNVSCYSGGRIIAGVALNLNLGIVLNYSVNGTSRSETGKAYIV